MLQLGTEERRMENNDRKEKRTNRILFLATVIPAILAVLAFFGLGTFKDVRNALFGAKEEDSAEERQGTDMGVDHTYEVIDHNDETLLVNRTIAESAGAEVVYGVKDALGRECGAALKLSEWGGTSYATYYIGDQYSRFTGILTAPEDTDSDVSYLFYAAVNNDPDQKVWTIDMSRSLKPTEINIDLTGCDYVTFVARMPESGIIYTTGALITEGKFE